MMAKRIGWTMIQVALLGWSLMGCGSGHDHDHAGPDHGDEETHSHGHEHVAPHGGAAVVLGEELYHLEFVLSPESGLLSCYVLDGHMENFVRIAAEEISVTIDGETEVRLAAVANRATGEAVGSTSQFQASVDWANEKQQFGATIPKIEVKGTVFDNVTFRYPEGNESE